MQRLHVHIALVYTNTPHAAQVKHGCAADPTMLSRLEEAVFPAFQLVLTEDVQEFHPYVFQIFAQLIELRPPPVAPVYMQLLPGLLSPTFWERAGNVPALVRLVEVRMRGQRPVAVVPCGGVC